MKAVTLPKLIAKCQALFNEYVRTRDASGDHFKCISCGQIKPIKFMHAGHFYSVGQYAGLRFDEDNVSGQCSACNTFLHGNLIEYREGLINKIGLQRFMDLEMRAKVYKRIGYKFSRTEIEEKIKELRQKINELNER